MRDRKIFDLLQISDLHVGSAMTGGNAPTPPFTLRFPLLEGLLGHHRAALVDLHSFYTREKVSRPDIRVALTGDLTTDGSAEAFDLAADFIGGNGGRSFGFGLDAAGWIHQSVSGNHDQWGGVGHPFGRSVPRLRRHLPGPFPVVGRPLRLPDGTTLRFILVDSDADVPHRWRERLLARGRFATQLDRLEALLGPADADEVRVLVLHHALSIETTPGPAGAQPFPLLRADPLRKLEIDLATMKQLQRLLGDKGIRVVLSGHVHEPRLSIFGAQGSSGVPLPVLEARCGTTTQRDRYTAQQIRQIRQAERAFHQPPRPALPRNTLVLHELWRRGDGRREWRSTVHIRRDGAGFLGPDNPRSKLPAHAAREALVF